MNIENMAIEIKTEGIEDQIVSKYEYVQSEENVKQELVTDLDNQDIIKSEPKCENPDIMSDGENFSVTAKHTDMVKSEIKECIEIEEHFLPEYHESDEPCDRGGFKVADQPGKGNLKSKLAQKRENIAVRRQRDMLERRKLHLKYLKGHTQYMLQLLALHKQRLEIMREEEQVLQTKHELEMTLLRKKIDLKKLVLERELKKCSK